MSHRELLLSSALERFALEGFVATSIQHIADDAGVSKATVLYHFTSKEDLLEHALTPTLDSLERLLDSVPTSSLSNSDNRAAFIDSFVPFLIFNRLGIHIVVTHAHLAPTHPGLTRATTLMTRMADTVQRSSASDIDALRFGVAIAGATYALVSETLLGVNQLEPLQLEQALTAVLTDMIAPRDNEKGTR